MTENREEKGEAVGVARRVQVISRDEEERCAQSEEQEARGHEPWEDRRPMLTQVLQLLHEAPQLSYISLGCSCLGSRVLGLRGLVRKELLPQRLHVPLGQLGLAHAAKLALVLIPRRLLQLFGVLRIKGLDVFRPKHLLLFVLFLGDECLLARQVHFLDLFGLQVLAAGLRHDCLRLRLLLFGLLFIVFC